MRKPNVLKLPKTIVGPVSITSGKETGKIPVQISYRIIQLFSEGLYASPNKAIEELVSNAFDAGASCVHVVLSPDRSTPDAFIAVVDDGIGMDPTGLHQHWRIGESNKRELKKPPKGRKQIGKFGIGKLATYVLATHLTHICKVGGKYYTTTMNYNDIPEGTGGGLQTEKIIELPLRELSEQEAKEELSSFLTGTKPGYDAIKMFGKDAALSWTVAIMSGLKDMAREIKKGQLSWVLRTAMPLRDDFKLYLDGDFLSPSKASTKPIQRWVLGKDIQKIDKPAPDDLEVTIDEKASPEQRFGLTHSELGRITGYAEVYQDSLTIGKSSDIDRSHGFFVNVYGRLINVTDPLFGMEPLHHGTFARFRMVVNIDQLDKELRSSRESLREGRLVTISRDILHAVFNLARSWLQQHDEEQAPGAPATGRIAQSPWSLTRRPIIGLLKSAFDGKATPIFLVYPTNLTKSGQEEFLRTLGERAKTEGGLVLKTELDEKLSQDQGVAILDVDSGTLKINALHPFVAAHREDYERGRETLGLLAMAEVLTEAHLYELGIEPSQAKDIMAKRDELLRHFARAMKRTANMVAQDLEDASHDENRLEKELVAAFDSMGFNAVPLGGKGRPDGKADAPLGAGDDGRQRRYSVSLEAKSKLDKDKKVSAKTVGISTVALHRDEWKCDHAVVVGPDFPTSQGGNSSLTKQAESEKKKSGKPITIIRVVDLARLVRLVPLKGIGLDRIRELFQKCVSPEECKSWIDTLLKDQPVKPPYKAILDVIWALQEEVPAEAVEFAAVTTALRKDKKIEIRKTDFIELCKAMSRMAPQVVVRENTVELTQRPDKIIETAGAVLQQFPEEEQKNSIFKFSNKA